MDYGTDEMDMTGREMTGLSANERRQSTWTMIEDGGG